VDDLSRTVRDRGVLPDTDFAKTLSECESCRYDPNVLSSTALRLVQDLFDYSVRFKLIRAPERENKTWKPS
jgi:hypothetical protein